MFPAVGGNVMRTFQFLTLMIVALGLSPGMAHLLELPPKMGYDAELYMAVTSTLYRLFGSVGAVIQVGSVVMVGVLCWLVRGRRSFGPALAAGIFLVLSLGLWSAIVLPVNMEWGRALQLDHATAVASYRRLRPRWEYGHVAAFLAWLSGFGCLAASVLTEIPRQDSNTQSTPAEND
jgi:hypothetical protein